MPTVRQPRPRRFVYRNLPLWLQWGLPLGIAITAIVALVIWVNYESNDVPAEAGVNSPSAIAQQNRQDDTLMRQIQAPQTAKMKPGTDPATGLRVAISAWLDHQISLGTYNGPLTRATCSPTQGGSSSRVPLSCDVIAASVKYEFYGVVVPATGQITYCQKVVYPPVDGMPTIPLSKRCT